MLQVNKNWRIQTDTDQFILEQLKKGKNPQTKEPTENWIIHGYYGTFDSIFKAICNQTVRDSQLEDLEKLAKQIEAIGKVAKSIDKRLTI